MVESYGRNEGAAGYLGQRSSKITTVQARRLGAYVHNVCFSGAAPSELAVSVSVSHSKQASGQRLTGVGWKLPRLPVYFQIRRGDYLSWLVARFHHKPPRKMARLRSTIQKAPIRFGFQVNIQVRLGSWSYRQALHSYLTCEIFQLKAAMPLWVLKRIINNA